MGGFIRPLDRRRRCLPHLSIIGRIRRRRSLCPLPPVGALSRLPSLLGGIGLSRRRAGITVVVRLLPRLVAITVVAIPRPRRGAAGVALRLAIPCGPPSMMALLTRPRWMTCPPPPLGRHFMGGLLGRLLGCRLPSLPWPLSRSPPTGSPCPRSRQGTIIFSSGTSSCSGFGPTASPRPVRTICLSRTLGMLSLASFGRVNFGPR